MQEKSPPSQPDSKQHVKATKKSGLHTCLHVLAACSPDLCGPGYGCPESAIPAAALHPFLGHLVPTMQIVINIWCQYHQGHCKYIS
jgi:hypothetical protein